MKINRRQFLKIAGASTVLGLGGTAVVNMIANDGLEASHVMTDERALLAKRWAMAIDMRKFTTEEDYRRVINACHSIHNVPDIGNPKDEVKWIWSDGYEHVFPGQENEYMEESIKELPFIVLCNHCDNPPCVRVCPTKATFKRKDGIVMMDQHRCIGCRFCMAACPFGARSFNWKDPRPFIKKENLEYPTRTKGVVEKCTFCFERIAKGLIPACVEASQAIAKERGGEPGMFFGDLQDQNSEVRKILSSHFSIRRKPELGTEPSVFYIIGGENNG
ncbi:MAG: sulfate reduction electron transfer complex DsrMKJOP subunit DsrO [Thermodesulfovibrionales bacterium]|jgi:molybdopterin-containing oxidoreductase family iron-sulfur binding subunit